ncbi:MAG: hypothetical protein IJZ75_05265 [Clostridia bacterium]|nr:hypothetical protein [Clostridia bacterium]
MNLLDFDSNFKDKLENIPEDIVFYNIEEEPFKVYAVKKQKTDYCNEGCYCRMDYEYSKTVSDGVSHAIGNPAGGRIRFRTNSPSVTIAAKEFSIPKAAAVSNMSSSGFDIYVEDDKGGSRCFKSAVPPADNKNGFVFTAEFESSEMRGLTINMPTTCGLIDVNIGIKKGCALEAPLPYTIEKPLVFYGSSITQGQICSRPGNSYEAIISRHFNCDFLNFGFSGNAKGEAEAAEYFKKLPMSAFILDYDHNAPSHEHLKATHEPFFKIIREANPKLPIIIMSRPVFEDDADTVARREIIKATYDNAIKNGDENVYFLSGKELMAIARCEGLVDNCHPNDLGFYSMAQALIGVLEDILK